MQDQVIGMRRAVYLGVGFASAAVLMLEIVLTRLFAVTQFYHFAFVTVGLALLGFGVSGSVLTAVPALGRGGPRRWALLAACQGIATVVAYVVTNQLPFDSYSLAWDGRQVVYLVVFYVALGVPFFFGGAVIGILLAGWDQPHPVPANRIYAANLVGSGTGCLLALGALPLFGGVGVVLLAAACAVVGALAFAGIEERRSTRRRLVLAGLLVVVAVAVVFPPAFLELRLSPYKELSAVLRYPQSAIVETRWTSGPRVDHVRSPGIRSLPGLSFTYPEAPPSQDGLTFDGDDLSPVPLVPPEAAGFASHLLVSLPFSLRRGGDMLVLEPRGGLDVVAALAAGASSVTAVEASRPAVEIVRRSGTAYSDPRVRLVVDEPRAYVERATGSFDVVDLALTAPYRPVTSGAYSLAEDYRLTVEAFDGYLDLLRPDGMLAILRWLQTPPSESLRVVALAAASVRGRGGDPVRSVVALRGYSTVLVLVQPGGFGEADLQAIRRFGEEQRFDVMAAPGLTAADANRFNVLPDDPYYRLSEALLSGSQPAELSAAGFDVLPPTDDHPFFGHFFTWAQAPAVWAELGTSWQPFGGAGYFVLLAFFILSLVAASLLILVPLWVRRMPRDPGRLRLWTVAYFTLLGIGFLFVELPIFQQYILLLGRPTTSLAVVLFVLLVSSGLGSRMSDRVGWRAGASILTLLAAVFPLVTGVLGDVILASPLAVRIIAGGGLLVPVGFLMGIMFPKGLARLGREAPGLVPWAWGINGAASVISSAAAALLALSFGFTAVVRIGAVCYGLCALLARPVTPPPG